MKLDSGHIVSPGSVGHNAECKPVEYANNSFDSTMLKFVKENDKENRNGVQSDLKGRVDSDQLEYEVENVGGHEHDVGKGYLSDDSEKAVREDVGATSPSHPYAKPQLFKNSFFYVDKNVMERALPEVVVYNGNTFQVVKDICIDEGLPSQNRFLLDSDAWKKSLSTIPPPEKETSTQIIRGSEDPDALIPGAFKSPIEKTDLRHHPPDDLVSSQKNDSQSDSSISSSCKALQPGGDERDDNNEMAANVLSKDNWSLKDLLSMKHWGTELSWPKSFDSQEARDKSQSDMDSQGKPQNDSLEVSTSKAEESVHGAEAVSSIVPAVNTVVSEPDHPAEELEIVHQAMGTESAALASEFKELDDLVKEVSNPNELTRHSKMEAVSVALDFDSTAPASICEESGPQKSDGEHLEAQNASVLQSGGPEPSSSHPRYSQGETSFSDAVPFSGLITYTGPIAYSGSLSIRSDSSTTSTRSFAFPVLQSEWNSSPVRMAKADRKHLGRRRRWRHGLLCCKF